MGTACTWHTLAKASAPTHPASRQRRSGRGQQRLGLAHQLAVPAAVRAGVAAAAATARAAVPPAAAAAIALEQALERHGGPPALRLSGAPRQRVAARRRRREGTTAELSRRPAAGGFGGSPGGLGALKECRRCQINCETVRRERSRSCNATHGHKDARLSDPAIASSPTLPGYSVCRLQLPPEPALRLLRPLQLP